MAYEAKRDNLNYNNASRNNSSNSSGGVASKAKDAAKLGTAIASHDPIAIAREVKNNDLAKDIANKIAKNGVVPGMPGINPGQNFPVGNNQVSNNNNKNNEADDEIKGKGNNSFMGMMSNSDDLSGMNPFRKKSKGYFSDLDDDFDEDDSERDAKGKGNFNIVTTAMKIKIISFAIPIVLIIFMVLLFMGQLTTRFSDFNDAFGANDLSGGPTGNLDFEAASSDAKKFYERVNDVRLDMLKRGMSADNLRIVAVYHIMNVYNNDYDYDYMTKRRIKEIAYSALKDKIYDKDTFRDNLKNDIFVKYFPDFTDKYREKMVDEVFLYMEDFLSLVSDSSSCGALGSCTYEIKGFANGNNNVERPMHISNLKVRLMECGAPFDNRDYYTPIPNQDLVPFEDYVAGVAYGEMGAYYPIEAIKAMMVAARSYALARPIFMGSAGGKKLEQEDGQWILQMANCVADQIYCDINQGCSFMGNLDGGQGGTVFNGILPNPPHGKKKPLPPDRVDFRAAAEATRGEVLVNDQGNIIQTGYVSGDAHHFRDLANEGYNYKEILIEHYSSYRNYNAANVQKMQCNTGSSQCSAVSSGPFASWKQYQGPWINEPMGQSGMTIKQIGCLVTSLAILVAKSGVPTTIDNFNPGTFVRLLSEHGRIGSNGNYNGGVNLAAPSFVQAGSINIHNYSRQEKFNTISDLLDKGYYIVAEVKGSTGQHWVAIDTIVNGEIMIMDPGSSATHLWDENYSWQNTSRLIYHRVS